MLVLSRKQNEKIVLPGLGVTIEVLHVSGNTVKIGIAAPREINVVRGEIVGKAVTDEEPLVPAGNPKAAKKSPRSAFRATNRPSEPMTSPTGNAAARCLPGADARSKPSAPLTAASAAAAKSVMR